MSPFVRLLLAVALVFAVVVVVYLFRRSSMPGKPLPTDAVSDGTCGACTGGGRGTVSNSGVYALVPPDPNAVVRRCREAREHPVLDSYVEMRSASDACPSPSRLSPAQTPNPDVTACPFLQRTNNQPAPVSERTVPVRGRPGSTCPRINVWWSDRCGAASL